MREQCLASLNWRPWPEGKTFSIPRALPLPAPAGQGGTAPQPRAVCEGVIKDRPPYRAAPEANRRNIPQYRRRPYGVAIPTSPIEACRRAQTAQDKKRYPEAPPRLPMTSYSAIEGLFFS